MQKAILTTSFNDGMHDVISIEVPDGTRLRVLYKDGAIIFGKLGRKALFEKFSVPFIVSDDKGVMPLTASLVAEIWVLDEF